MALLEGKTGIVFGVANKRSIAWAIAQALSREGMRLAFTYQGERLKENVEALTSTIPGSLLLPCDVTNDAEIDAVYARGRSEFGRLDALLHSVAFAPKEDLENDFVNTSREGFKLAHDISAYSLVALTRAALPLFEKVRRRLRARAHVLRRGESGRRLQRHGRGQGVARSERALSGREPRPAEHPRQRPLRRPGEHARRARHQRLHRHAQAPRRDARRCAATWSSKKIGNAGLFLLSNMSSGITGEVMFVDCGYNMVGL